MTTLVTPPQSPPATADLAVDQITLTVIDNYLATTLAVREFGSAGPPKLVEVSP